MNRTIWAQGLRKKLENGKKRHPFQAIHCYRKWFKTRCEIAAMKPINCEILLAHNVGISSSYYKPTERELLEDYLKVVNLLCIDRENKLQIQLNEYKEKNSEENYIIQGKLQEKENQINQLNEKYEKDMQLFKEEMENKFQELIAKIDVQKIIWYYNEIWILILSC